MGVNSTASYDIHNTNYLGTPVSKGRTRKFKHACHKNGIVRFLVKSWRGVWARLRSLTNVVEILGRKVWGA